MDAGPVGTLIYYENYDDGGVPSRFGSQDGATLSISTDTTANSDGSAGSLRGVYPAPGAGDVYIWGVYDLSSLNTEEVFVEFRAKMPTNHEGLKFTKVFGGNSNGNYANTTFGLDYTGVDDGSMQYVGFGDGTDVANDTENGVWLDGSTDAPGAYHGVGRSLGTAVVETPQNTPWASSNWSSGWHHFKLHVKFNSGTTAQNEVADGALDVIIDDVVWVHATHLFNRNPSNAPIDRVELFGWSQAGTQPFEIWYDEVKISLGNWVD